jgi:hypothetical protein
LTLSAHPAVIENLEAFSADAGEGYAGIGRLVHHQSMPGYRMDRYDIVSGDGYSADSDGGPGD